MSKLISYEEIRNNYESSWYIPYDILLNTVEWRKLRETILQRDSKKCTICGKEQSERMSGHYFRKPTEEEIDRIKKEETVLDLIGDGSLMLKLRPAIPIGVPDENPTILHVHHKYYVFNCLPWKYDQKALITVCHNCHAKIHAENTIPVYADNDFNERIPLTPCKRCNGTGYLDQYYYVQNGICFRCRGRKFEEFIEVD